MKSIFVGNLDLETTEGELRSLFETYGQVEQIYFIRDRESGLPRGFAFVEMTKEPEADKAIRALEGTRLRNRTLMVEYARPRPERPAA